VSDIGWLRLTLWRELMAGLFEHPLLGRELSQIRNVRIDVAQPGSTLRVAKAAYLCGWLAAMLGWQVGRPLQRPAEEDQPAHGSFRRGRREIGVEIRPVHTSLDGSVQAAGSIVRVELETGRARSQVRARITRQRDHLLATADWNGAQVSRRAARLEPFEETPFIAEALERPGLDRIFERSLVRAVRFTGG
jgi:glucose-6-phosphate dehydrogenase assembly protein OpcA